jgi:hypothetical protein
MAAHPSGDPSPTPEDIAATEQLAIIAELIGIPLLDHHIVVGDPGYTSLRDLRLMPPESIAPSGSDTEEGVAWAEEESELESQNGLGRGPAFLLSRSAR